MAKRTAPCQRSGGGVHAVLGRYSPTSIPADLWLSQLRELILSAVLRLDPPSPAVAIRFARLLARIATWAISESLPLDWEIVLDPDTVERFVTSLPVGARSRATYRADLRRIGPALTRRAPWPPPPAVLPRRAAPHPYSAGELDSLRRIALLQSSPLRRRSARALVTLGAGAGLDGRWVAGVRAVDVSRHDDGVLVQVGPPNARAVPVLAAFEDDVAELAARAGDQFLVGGTSTCRNRAGELASRIEVPRGVPRLSVPRLRATWLVHHLTVGTRLPELANAAGLVGVAVLSDLLSFVPAAALEDAHRMLRGVLI